MVNHTYRNGKVWRLHGREQRGQYFIGFVMDQHIIASRIDYLKLEADVIEANAQFALLAEYYGFAMGELYFKISSYLLVRDLIEYTIVVDWTVLQDLYERCASMLMTPSHYRCQMLGLGIDRARYKRSPRAYSNFTRNQRKIDRSRRR